MFGLTYQKDLNILQEMSKRENNKQTVSTAIFGYGRNDKNENTDFKTYRTKQNRVIEDMKKINLEIRSELEDIQRIIDNTSSTKDKLEGKKVKTTLLQTSLNIMKEVSGINTTVKKEKDNTDKLNGTLIQGGEVNIGGGNANSIMNTFRSGGSSHSINSIQHMPTVPNNSIVIQNVQTPVNNTAYNGQLPVNENMKSEATNNSESNIQLIEESSPDNTVENIINSNTPDVQPAEVIVNALGQTIVNKPVEDFVELTGINPLMKLDYNQSLINLNNRNNPNIKDYFKYNQEYKMGWLIKFDEETQTEVEGTVLPLEHVYPFKINTQTRTMISSLNLSYKVILTDSEPSEAVKEFYENRWRKEEESKS